MKPILSFAVAAVFLASTNLAVAASRSHRDMAAAPTAESTQAAQPMAADNQFASEAEARSHCRSDTVVWVNTRTHVYHFAGNAAYGHTKHGAFMCRTDADRTGKLRAAKREAAAQPGTSGTSAPSRR